MAELISTRFKALDFTGLKSNQELQESLEQILALCKVRLLLLHREINYDSGEVWENCYSRYIHANSVFSFGIVIRNAPRNRKKFDLFT